MADCISSVDITKAVCFCGTTPSLCISQLENTLGRLYLACGQKEKCSFFQCADTSLATRNVERSRVHECAIRNHHPSRDAHGFPLKGWDIPRQQFLSRSARDEIEVVDSTNEIVHPPELRGLIYTRELEKQWLQGKLKTNKGIQIHTQ